ncbi:hypothetical protein L227DRAFT_580741 [Lentinus tigrinus ALCF2SS1-6]|uniref:Zn(2)-C6 fungal-type domain-containing protein n=1 Tax=Lentinus tigrinus ALCF2SS1-6 TaxID=1328759 RepID=A0A5C2RRH2_9APHY|nr:hypothetical protein L227DRAFT_580741 [Lentinus tigrinus ALCF2SS1-6]
MSSSRPHPNGMLETISLALPLLDTAHTQDRRPGLSLKLPRKVAVSLRYFVLRESRLSLPMYQCEYCHRTHRKCDGPLPCIRCRDAGWGHSCVPHQRCSHARTPLDLGGHGASIHTESVDSMTPIAQGRNNAGFNLEVSSRIGRSRRS